MSAKKYQASDLESFCDEITETTIVCTNCGKEDGMWGETDYAVKDFFRRGWRSTPKNCYCPKCAPKKLKL